MNYQSQPLQSHEIESMKADPVIIGRIITSYKLMLDFYGMQLVSPDSGLVDRSLPPRNYAARYSNLVRKLTSFNRGSTYLTPILTSNRFIA